MIRKLIFAAALLLFCVPAIAENLSNPLAQEAQALQRNILIICTLSILAIMVVMSFYIRKIKALNRELTESNAIKDKLFSIIGHDLRSPVSNVVQMMDILGSIDFSTEERVDIIATLKKHSEASLETLDNLLQWGKSQLQGIRVKPTEIFPQVIFEKNLEAYSLQTAQKSIAINNQIPDSLTVFADADHLNFIVRNLVSNAVKFTYPSGTIKITAAQHDAENVAFSISDHGIGMNAASKRSVFKNFPVIAIGTANEKGTGIGLMLCKEFAEANGGKIWVESEEGRGSTFSFTLKGKLHSESETALREIEEQSLA